MEEKQINSEFIHMGYMGGKSEKYWSYTKETVDNNGVEFWTCEETTEAEKNQAVSMRMNERYNETQNHE